MLFGHSAHAALPVCTLNDPGKQAVHVPPFAPVNPALQVQEAISVLETGAFEFKGHAEHVDKTLAPTAAEYDAVPQSVHAALPALVLYLPATHAVRLPPSAPVNPALQVQAVMTVLETGAFAFEGHARQVDTLLAPTTAEYVAIPQSVHVALPALVLYFPATQAEHVAPFAPVKPALHIHAPLAELDTCEVEFVGHAKHTDNVLAARVAEKVTTPQSVHATLPLVVLYLPATHPEHTSPSAPVNPALQLQAALPELETGAFEFEGHVKQVDEALAPTAAEYVAVPQSVHAALPSLVLYLPAAHNAHAPGAPVLPAGQSD